MIEFGLLCLLVMFLSYKIYDMLVISSRKVLKGSSGRCHCCGEKSNIRYEYKGKMLCQFCDDYEMGK